MTNKNKTLPKIIKKVWMALAVLVISAAVISSFFRSLTPLAVQYKHDVEVYFSQLIGQPVSIQSMKTGWYWFFPVLKLDSITIVQNKRSIHLEQLFVGIDPLQSLLYWRIQPGLLYLNKAHLVVRKTQNGWEVDGVKTNTNHSLADSLPHIITLLAQQGRLIIKDFSLNLYLENKNKLLIRDLNFSMLNHMGDYKIKGAGREIQHKDSAFQLLADLHFEADDMQATFGRIYLSAQQLLLAQWQQLVPSTYRYVNQGSGSLKLWLELQRGALSAAQAQLMLEKNNWTYKNKHIAVPHFFANLLWKPDKNGWLFNADHIALQLDKTTWPANEVSIRYSKQENSYSLFAKHILIESLMQQLAPFNISVLQHVGAINVQGLLQQVQIAIKNNQINYLLTQFEHLRWSQLGSIPAVDNLSGVIEWTLEKGHLALDSHSVSVALQGYPKQKITLLNGNLKWDVLPDGVHLAIERAVVTQPQLQLDLHGTLDGITANSFGFANLKMSFLARNVEQWMRYLPQKKMKKSLFDWLNKDIKRIAQANGQVIIKGNSNEFPFDEHNGEFSITSHLLGGALFITPQWPLIKDIEGYIRVKNRNFDMDIVHGDAQGIPINQMHLRIDDMGRDKETLLLHSIIEGQAQKMLHFVLASPLKQQLKKLQQIAINGLLRLDLNLEIPLYPGNDNNLVKGILTCAQNIMFLNYKDESIPIEELRGSLTFDEHRVTQGHIRGMLLDKPLDININTSTADALTTLVNVAGVLSIDALKERFNLSTLPFIKGFVPFNALVTMPARAHATDVVVINSSLQGLSIDLPALVGKKTTEIAPLKVNLLFPSETTSTLHATYNNKLAADIHFEQDKEGEIALKSGQISIGTINARAPKAFGLNITGVLEEETINQWQHVFANSFADKNEFSLIDKISSFDFTISRLAVLQQAFEQISITGAILPSREWSLIIRQKKMAADLIYNRFENTINGFVRYLHLDKMQPKLNKVNDASIKPNTVPNLNIRVEDFTIGRIAIGNVTLKSHATKNRWMIDYCQVETPAYKAKINGQWTQNNNLNQTSLELSMHVNNLAKSLQLWDINPRVDASRGDLVFYGGWNDALYDFSLAKLKGTLSLQLNDGRITHLSKKTEEQLGLGKLLSILSLQTIPRRLKLDFSDLSEDGYSFDVFKGEFVVKNGIVSTQDSFIDGPVAYGRMSGDLDVIRQLYALNLSISPHITASLPIVATIAGGPIVGVATWVASKIINQGMQKISAYSYTISGPWSDPVVHQLSIMKAIMNNHD